MKLIKTEKDNELVIERILHAKNYMLILDRDRCLGCGICKEVCPKEAIEIKIAPKVDQEKAELPVIDIDEQKCHFCGICNSICPFGALKLKVDGEQLIPVIKTESFPQLIREIKIDTEKCEAGCVECEEACPLKLIKVSVLTPEGEEVKDVESWPNKENLRVVLDLDDEHCPCCRLCEMRCPDDAISVRKMFLGNLKITQEKCPEGCQDCLDVCPIETTLYLSENDKVNVNELTCIYCGVCKYVCPEEGALDLQRTYVHHTLVKSGAWNKALEKLASTKEMSKELKAKSLTKTRETVNKRLSWRTS
jgi:4Fe-4S ferredoxin